MIGTYDTAKVVPILSSMCPLKTTAARLRGNVRTAEPNTLRGRKLFNAKIRRF
jgi:hypothetical protein